MKLYKAACIVAARAAYAAEIEGKELETEIIGEGKMFKDVDAWVEQRVKDWCQLAHDMNLVSSKASSPPEQLLWRPTLKEPAPSETARPRTEPDPRSPRARAPRALRRRAAE